MKKIFCFGKGFSTMCLDQHTDPHLYLKKAFMNVFSPPYSQDLLHKARSTHGFGKGVHKRAIKMNI